MKALNSGFSTRHRGILQAVINLTYKTSRTSPFNGRCPPLESFNFRRFWGFAKAVSIAFWILICIFFARISAGESSNIA